MVTLETTVNNPLRAVMALKDNRFHQSPALARPITGMDIHMPAIETSRAVISVADARDRQPALPASKIF